MEGANTKSRAIKAVLKTLSDVEFERSFLVFDYLYNITRYPLSSIPREIPLARILGTVNQKDIQIAVSVGRLIYHKLYKKEGISNAGTTNVYEGGIEPTIKEFNQEREYGPFIVGLQNLPLEDIFVAYRDSKPIEIRVEGDQLIRILNQERCTCKIGKAIAKTLRLIPTKKLIKASELANVRSRSKKTILNHMHLLSKRLKNSPRGFDGIEIILGNKEGYQLQKGIVLIFED